ncbi:MAG: lipid-A-disaccharide synthase, partial [Rhodospirillaceae bacterium]|nr:lipid-A-disaccharide synthase [Rhodospirillaceae bacterium]
MTAPLVYLVAGEPSGDLLGARLMAGLKEMTGGAVAFAGVGGEAMRAQGMTSLFPQADLAAMG